MTTNNHQRPKAERAPAELSAEKQAWLAIRKTAAEKINPETAELMWCYAQTLDPYGIHPDLPEELQQVGREFARSPESDVWVWFGDLPVATEKALWERMNVEDEALLKELAPQLKALDPQDTLAAYELLRRLWVLRLKVEP